MHLHIAIAVLAYSLLALAGVQALFVNSHEKALHKHQAKQINLQLPPLETMESLLFNMLWGGFILLSLTLVSGIFFSEQIFGKALVFNHHILLSAGAWLVFGTFLFGLFRKKIYSDIEMLQADLDEFMKKYNHERTHQGKRCKGRTPMETFIEGKKLVIEKNLEERLAA